MRWWSFSIRKRSLPGGEALGVRKRLEVFGKPETLKGEKITVFLTLPENWENCRHLDVFALNGGEKLLWYEASVKRLKEARRTPQFYLEEELVDGKTEISISGAGLQTGAGKDWPF